MHLSSAARSAGWTGLVRGPEQYKAAELEPYLRDQFYDGKSFWRLFEPLLRWGLSSCLPFSRPENGSLEGPAKSYYVVRRCGLNRSGITGIDGEWSARLPMVRVAS